jgi:hypothetical protein
MALIFLSGCLTSTNGVTGATSLTTATQTLSGACDGDLNSVLTTSGCVSINDFHKYGIETETDPQSLHLTDLNYPSRFSYVVIANPPWGDGDLNQVDANAWFWKQADLNWLLQIPDFNRVWYAQKDLNSNNLFWRQVDLNAILQIPDFNRVYYSQIDANN